MGEKLTREALATMQDGYHRLKKLGWNDATYAPKDGSLFEVVQLGSVGIFKCTYSGEWPDGNYMLQDGRDIYPQGPGGLLWRALKQ